MALTDTICMMGQWISDFMLKHLHTYSQTSKAGLEARMVQHGDYALIPTAPKV